jgi:hypothetical protein
MSRKRKNEYLNQNDAKAENGKPTTLDQIWGDTGLSKYGTKNFEDYKDYLRGLNKTDIQAHAIQIGILPIDNHEILLARLEREFLRHVGSYNTPQEKTKTKRVSKDVQRILSEGR